MIDDPFLDRWPASNLLGAEYTAHVAGAVLVLGFGWYLRRRALAAEAKAAH